MADKKSTGIFIAVIVVLLLALGGAYFFSLKPPTPTPDATQEQTAAVEDEAAPSEEQAATEEMEVAPTTPAELAAAGINLDDVLSERVLGDPNAPIKIAEFASLTCSHCGH